MWAKDEGYHCQQFHCNLSKILEKEGFEQDSAKLDLVCKAGVCSGKRKMFLILERLKS